METTFKQDLIEKLGEDIQLEMILESSIKLSLALQQFKMSDKDEDYTEWVNNNNEVCERIAEMKLMIQQSEFIFNPNEIEKHHDLMLNRLKEKLTEY